ncbi:MAG: hypothetical protein ACN6QT_01965, partial [Burkholderia contaminans]
AAHAATHARDRPGTHLYRMKNRPAASPAERIPHALARSTMWFAQPGGVDTEPRPGYQVRFLNNSRRLPLLD